MWGNTQILPDTQIVRIWNWTNFKTGKKDTQGYNETVTSSEIAKIKNTENCKHWRWYRATGTLGYCLAIQLQNTGIILRSLVIAQVKLMFSHF